MICGRHDWIGPETMGCPHCRIEAGYCKRFIYEVKPLNYTRTCDVPRCQSIARQGGLCRYHYRRRSRRHVFDDPD